MPGSPATGRAAGRGTLGGLLACLLAVALPIRAQGLAPQETRALRLKAAGDHRGATAAFLAMLRQASGGPRAAALAEFHAEMAARLTQAHGDWIALRDTLDAVAEGPFGSAHPALAGRLRVHALGAALALGDVASVAQRTRTLAFLTHWWIVGPFDNERGAGYGHAFGPEQAFDLGADYDGKARPVRWRRLPVTEPPAGLVDLDAMVRPNDQVLCYAATALHADRDRDVVLHIGSDEAFVVFLNGARIAGRDLRRSLTLDQDAVVLPLRAGANLLMLKIGAQEGGFAFAGRITDLNGATADGVREIEGADALRDAARTAPRTSGAQPFLGARTILAETAATDGGDALRLAYILASLGADDPTDRRDHALARKAVELLPDDTNARFLLAYTRLRADARAEERDDNLLRRDYEWILEREPDHVQALTALADLELDGTGATEAAEKLLRRALQRNPASVATRLSLARVLDAQGLGPLAEVELQRAAAAGWPLALLRWGSALESHSALASAAEALEAAVAREARGTVASRVADLQLRRGQRDRALATLRRHSLISPFAAAPRLRIARLLEAEGDLRGAANEVQAWRTICPDDAGAAVILARLAGLQGDVQSQRRWLETAIDLDPNRERERRNLEFLSAAEQSTFYEAHVISGDEVLATDPGPPAGAAEANDPYYRLLDHRVVHAYRNGTTSEYRHTLLRVLTDEGGRRLSTWNVPHFWGEQRARILAARVIRKNGGTVEPRLRGSSVRLGPLEPGDAVEISSRIDDLAPGYFGDYFGLEHVFRTDDGVPCHRAVLTVVLEPGRDYRFQSANGAPEPRRSKDAAGNEVCRYEVRDIGRAIVEENQPAWVETEPLVRITTYESWDAFAQWWWNLIRRQIEVSPAMRAKVAELTDGVTEQRDQIAAIYRFVTTEVRYTAWEFGVHGYQPYSTAVIFERRHGDCKDKALLLGAMLGEIGIEAWPVLIHARELRTEDDLTLPMVQHFNHCISYLPTQAGQRGLFLDGTATYHDIDTLPAMDQGAEVVVVAKGKAELRTIPFCTAESNRDELTLEVAIAPSGDARVERRHRPRGAHAVAVRASLGNEPRQRRRKLAQLLTSWYGKLTLGELRCSDLADITQPVEVDVSFDVAGLGIREDRGVSIALTFESAGLLDLVAAETRRLPLLLGSPTSEVTTLRLRLADGMTPGALPAPVTLDTPLGSYHRTVRHDNGAIEIVRRRSIKGPRVDPDAYAEFRAFVIAADSADRERLVLRVERER